MKTPRPKIGIGYRASRLTITEQTNERKTVILPENTILVRSQGEKFFKELLEWYFTTVAEKQQSAREVRFY